MTRKEEIREAALITKEKLVDAPDSLKIAKAAINELVDTILELTTPESSPTFKHGADPQSPAEYSTPLESQEELWRDLWNYWDTDATKDELQSKFILTRRTEGGLEK